MYSNRYSLPQLVIILKAILILPLFSCDNDPNVGCRECDANLFVDSVQNLEISVVDALFTENYVHQVIQTHPEGEYLYGINYFLCSEISDTDLTGNDLLTINGAIYTPCQDSDIQFLKIDSYEVTGEKGKSCFIPNSEVSNLLPLSCEISEDIRDRFSAAALHSACIYKFDSSDYFLDTATPEIFLSALSSVFSSEIPEAQNVLEDFDDFSGPRCPDHLCLSLDDNEEWVQNILNGESISSNATFDSLMAVTNVAIEQEGSTTILGPQDQLVNLDSLASLLRPIEGVTFADPCVRYVGDGNYIYFQGFEGHILVSFRIGYGDCLAGCIFNTFYNFLVYEDCSVEFIEQCGNLRPSYDEVFFLN